ncbi:hypothetical protein PsorP6_007914 [Peronosclerospora sorghi]|uniref:Uncharacterized protein n=1 Tax=Peronosclerospora sorghi TaxID=230839 RepID=A0ACC0WBT4_9STRA|nr:hypothetical protein PsorP6_007914 [Peronosclerospora sorghi]
MEGYLIRIPLEACLPASRPLWRHKDDGDATSPVHSRVLYYVLEDGYLRGYESSSTLTDPIESIQLTGHRIEVNTMASHHIFEIKGQVVHPRPSQHVVDDTSSSDRSDDDSCLAHTTLSSPPRILCNKYHAVFFAATTTLMKQWALTLLNWKRNVFKHFARVDETMLQQAAIDTQDALREANGANQFLCPVQVNGVAPLRRMVSAEIVDRGPIDPVLPDDVSTLANDAKKLSSLTLHNAVPVIESAVVEKPSDVATQPPTSWWISPFGRSRKVLSHSLGRN